MDSSFSSKDEILFLRVCHHISNAVYLQRNLLLVNYGYPVNSISISMYVYTSVALMLVLNELFGLPVDRSWLALHDNNNKRLPTPRWYS